MKKLLLLVTHVLLPISYLLAENGAVYPDTSLQISPVTIVSNKPANLANVSRIGLETIENRYETSVLSLLSEEVPGLFTTQRGLMGYGVAGGAAGTINIRGLGGSPTSQVLMLIDGQPQYMGLMGHPLADTYLASMAEQVTVNRGPASVLYGSNALGGTININTTTPRQGIHNKAQVMYGSYNSLNTQYSNSIRKNKFYSYASLSYDRTSGHRENSDFERYAGFLKLGYDLNSNWRISSDLNLTQFEAVNPGTTASPMIDNDASIFRGMLNLNLGNTFRKSSGTMQAYLNFGKHFINDGYRALDVNPPTHRFNSKDYLLGLSAHQNFSLFEGNSLSAGIDLQHYGGQAWNTAASDGSRLTELADTSLYNLALYLTGRQQVGDFVSVHAGLRADKNQLFGLEWVPQAGIDFILNTETQIKALFSKGFRNPTIRELFMFVPKNPDLQPERIFNYELALAQKLFDQKLRMELNLFYMGGDNSIQIIYQADENRMKYVNTGEIDNWGLEFSANYALNRQLSFSGNYSWLHMENPVTGSPRHKLYLSALYRQESWSLSSGLQYIHGLYTQTGATPETENFTLWNVRSSYQLLTWMELFLKAENLLNQSYEINKGFPMPGITVFGGFRLNF